ncbi:RAM signaling network component, variant 2 [Basidiobolus ranarum]|uniref:RAM signaling network component, variant 2 n=1 Tax=Basidiobolus ranarum TaxID=34480 RepID=A0ABR2WXC2_9FUNG
MGGNLTKLIEQEKGSKTLNLGQKNISEIPPQIETLRDSLERLGLGQNFLNSLPLEIAKLQNLRYINLRANLFKEFPLVLCELPRLEILDLSKNKIRILPNELGKIKTLKVLSVARNRIKELPFCIGRMEDLQVLKIEHNPITFPPRHIAQSNHNSGEWLEHLKEYLREHSDTPDYAEDVVEENSTDDGSLMEHYARDQYDLRTRRMPSTESLSSYMRSDKLSITQENLAELKILMEKRSSDRRHQFGRSFSMPRGIVSEYSDNNGSLPSISLSRHSRGISLDSISSVDTQTSVDGNWNWDTYFLHANPIPKNISNVNGKWLAIHRSILFMMIQIYCAVQQPLALTLDIHTTAIFSGLLSDISNGMTLYVQILEKFERGLHQLRPQDFSGFHHDLVQACLKNINSFQKLVRAVYLNIKPLTRNSDIRITKNLLVVIHTGTIEIKNAYEALSQFSAELSTTSLVIGQNRFSKVKRGSVVLRDIEVNPELYTLAENTTAAATRVMLLLTESLERLNLGDDDTDKLNRQKDCFSSKIEELLSHLQTAESATKSLNRSLNIKNTSNEDSLFNRRFLEDIDNFVKAVITMASITRASLTELHLNKSVTSGLQALVRSTRELALLFAKSRPKLTTDDNSEMSDVHIEVSSVCTLGN